MDDVAAKNLAKFVGHCGFVVVLALLITSGFIFFSSHFTTVDNKTSLPLEITSSVDSAQTGSITSINQQRFAPGTASPNDNIASHLKIVTGLKITVNGQVVVEQSGDQIFLGDGMEIQVTRNGKIIALGDGIEISGFGNIQSINNSHGTIKIEQ